MECIVRDATTRHDLDSAARKVRPDEMVKLTYEQLDWWTATSAGLSSGRWFEPTSRTS